ncbi:MAG: MBL fold metallo-hydrolase [Trueperaceae bacterium]|nr:MBL fold metallo-hydrolase [Trueperaceae bacterium]
MLTVGPVAANAYLVTDEATGATVVIDPGDEAPRLLAALAEAGRPPVEIWLTHAHFDHIGAVAALRETHPVPVRLHPADAPLYDNAEQQAGWFGMRVRPPGVAPVDLADGERLALGGHRFEVRHTPGHAPGHVAFYAADAGVLFSGDALFRGSVGRTDLPLCDPAALDRSLRERLLVLPDETRVLPGHGPETTIGLERRTNPFLA